MLFRSAAAQFNVGLMYADGEGTSKDDVKAEASIRKAAEQGYAEAQMNLGLRYAQGLGVPKNLVQAYVWYQLADAHGQQNAHLAKEALAHEMSSSQLAEAAKLLGSQ